ncbi:TetR/AcrR family transcriptional regulator [Pimelobacter simplex]|uniref:TetR/AcrR family transcriptional regulator n=1 Tax=Nocardioides simplex TaxID=2045 RepID=UPI003AAE2255
MNTEATPERGPTRLDRRKERTRAALVQAGCAFLAEGRTAVSIQQITDAADVGFGSFYNHFDSKEALFEAAVQSVMDVYVAFRDQAVAGYDDPAEVFAVSFRMTGRLQRQIPELVRVMLNEGTRVLVQDQGLAPRALHDIEVAVAAGRFDIESPRLGLMAAGGALLGLLQLLDADPDLDAGEVSDLMTARVLRGFGMPKAEADELCSRPLPAQPEL